MTIYREQYDDVATVEDLQTILDEIAENYGKDVEVTVPRSDGWCVPTHPTLIIEPDHEEDQPTLELTHEHA